MTITFPTVNGNDEVYTDCLNAMVGKERFDMVDLCSNLCPHTRKLGFKHRWYVDILKRDIGEEQEHFVQADVLEYLQKTGKYYDVSFCLDGIEHLKKMDGFRLLNLMKKRSNKQIIFTPLDWWMKAPEDNIDPEAHHSLWTPRDLSDEWMHIVFPVYHPTLGIGAWFGMRCYNLQEEFDRVQAELETKPWAKEMEVIE